MMSAADGQGGGRRVDQCRSGRDGGSVSPPRRNADRNFVCPASRRERGKPGHRRRGNGSPDAHGRRRRRGPVWRVHARDPVSGRRRYRTGPHRSRRSDRHSRDHCGRRRKQHCRGRRGQRKARCRGWLAADRATTMWSSRSWRSLLLHGPPRSRRPAPSGRRRSSTRLRQARRSPVCLPLCDTVVVNEIELGLLSGRSLSEAADASDLLEGMRAVRRTSDQVVITTRGGSGLLALGPEGVVEIAGRKVPVIDSTGAGDCFVGAFAAGLLVDRDLRRALALANAAAAVSVQRPGAGSSMPTREEVIEQFGASLPDLARPRGDGRL